MSKAQVDELYREVMRKSTRPAYIVDERLLHECEKIPNCDRRATVVHRLIEAYGLLNKLDVILPRPATKEEIPSFHSSDYLAYLERVSENNDDCEEDEEYGFGYDCPMISNVFEFAQHIAGASIQAAEALTSSKYHVAINWCGGWHHAQRDAASGFCYVNDIVLAIHKLKERFDRVLYVDLDAHHGDGVENAFAYTRSVLTFSMHRHEAGFFPGTGSVEECGLGNGKGYAINVPLGDSISDVTYCNLFDRLATKIHEKYNPDAIVIQCGADGLAGDPVTGGFSLTLHGVSHCVQTALKWGKPTLLLGGGGYHAANTARLWAYLTSVAIGLDSIPDEIPEHEYFELYGPDFCLHIASGLRSDRKYQERNEEVAQIIEELLEKIN